jgi:hypothetical protein
MKKLSLLALLLLTAVLSKAQLKNTKWQGMMNVPDKMSVILNFKKDSVDMLIVEYGMVGESMTYAVADSVITMKKTDGHSPCDVGGLFKVKYLIKDDKLFINNLSDPCDARSQSWNKEPFVRVKEQ